MALNYGITLLFGNVYCVPSTSHVTNPPESHKHRIINDAYAAFESSNLQPLSSLHTNNI